MLFLTFPGSEESSGTETSARIMPLTILWLVDSLSHCYYYWTTSCRDLHKVEPQHCLPCSQRSQKVTHYSVFSHCSHQLAIPSLISNQLPSPRALRFRMDLPCDNYLGIVPGARAAGNAGCVRSRCALFGAKRLQMRGSPCRTPLHGMSRCTKLEPPPSALVCP